MTFAASGCRVERKDAYDDAKLKHRSPDSEAELEIG